MFFVKAEMLGSHIMVTNQASEGRNEAVHSATLPLESDHFYPLLRGEDVAPFKAAPGMPRFDRGNKLHRELSELGKKARQSSLDNNDRRNLSVVSAELLGLSAQQAAEVTKELGRL